MICVGILSRFSDIMGASIESFIGKAEGKNADKLLEKYLRDTKESLAKVKAETAGIMAEETAAKRKFDECKSDIAKYENYAMSAVKAGNDEDARQFLIHIETLTTKSAELQQALSIAQENSEKMRQMTKKLIGNIQEAEGKLNSLKYQLSMAKQQENINKINNKISQPNFGNVDNLFDAVQKRIDTANAAADLNEELSGDNSIKDLEAKYSNNANRSTNNAIEDKLTQLKAKMNQEN